MKSSVRMILEEKRLETDNTARIHECYVCGKRDVWGLEWMTYGSLQDLEDFGFCIKICGDACKQKLPDIKSVYEAEVAEFGKRPKYH